MMDGTFRPQLYYRQFIVYWQVPQQQKLIQIIGIFMFMLISILTNKYFIIECLIQQFVCLCSLLRLWKSFNFHSALLYSLTKTVTIKIYAHEFSICYLQNTKSFYLLWGNFELWMTRILSKLRKDAVDSIVVKYLNHWNKWEKKSDFYSLRTVQFFYSGTVLQYSGCELHLNTGRQRFMHLSRDDNGLCFR